MLGTKHLNGHPSNQCRTLMKIDIMHPQRQTIYKEIAMIHTIFKAAGVMLKLANGIWFVMVTLTGTSDNKELSFSHLSLSVFLNCVFLFISANLYVLHDPATKPQKTSNNQQKRSTSQQHIKSSSQVPKPPTLKHHWNISFVSKHRSPKPRNKNHLLLCTQGTWISRTGGRLYKRMGGKGSEGSKSFSSLKFIRSGVKMRLRDTKGGNFNPYLDVPLEVRIHG